jgi:predicted enzyme related to lactoylglutathione lyase
MLKLNTVMLGTKQTKAMVAFYEGLIGEAPGMADSEHGFFGWQLGGVYFAILEHSEMGGKSKDGGRIMLNFETQQVQQEFERVKALGATVVREPYEMGGGKQATLADPDGNYFQLVTPM